MIMSGPLQLVDLQQQIHDFDGVPGVEVAGGFVKEQQLWFVGQRASDSHALLFAPTQLRREVLHAVLQADHGQQLLGPLA
eukprot:EC785141.1.p4 GENE.EC785141.1~~EC785141.1.p4  ORF type:complete len:80 (-),score=18.82 EC785141.1:96-335(-)